MERNISWGMLTTLNGNCATLLLKNLYESKSSCCEWACEPDVFLTLTNHNDETASGSVFEHHTVLLHIVFFFSHISMLS